MFNYKTTAIGCLIIALLVVMYKKYNAYDYYTAAIVEYEPVEYKSARKMITENLDNYEKIILNSSHYNVDIIIFPECGLTGINIPQIRYQTREYLTEIPDPEDYIIPHLSTRYNSQILNRISYAAKSYGVYIVINLPEIAYCSITDPDCPDDEAYYYNTNIVFDRNGAIIARYRKINLFTEWAFNKPKYEIDAINTFTTDFGVTFSMFTCFDILFKKPSVEISQLADNIHIIYTTAWMSQYPFLTAITTHSLWAYSRKKTMLSANYNNVSGALTGSGIYLPNGHILISSINRADNKILISSVPKNEKYDIFDDDVYHVSFYSIFNYFRLSSLYDIFMNFIAYKLPLRKMLIMPEITRSMPRTDVMKFYFARELYKFYTRPLEKYVDDGQRGAVQTEFRYKSKNDLFECYVDVIYERTRFDYKLLGGSCEQNLTVTFGHMEACGLSLYPTPEAGDNDNAGLISVPGTRTKLLNVNALKIVLKSNYSALISFPVSLTSEFQPLNVNYFTFSESSYRTENEEQMFLFEIKLNKPIQNLLTFAVYKLQTNNF